MHKPYTFRLTAPSELSFNLTHEGYACGAFNQKCFSILKFLDVPMTVASCCGRPHLGDFDDLSLGVIGLPYTHLLAILKIFLAHLLLTSLSHSHYPALTTSC